MSFLVKIITFSPPIVKHRGGGAQSAFLNAVGLEALRLAFWVVRVEGFILPVQSCVREKSSLAFRGVVVYRAFAARARSCGFGKVFVCARLSR